jgi:SSS family solute:Na+ symporter
MTPMLAIAESSQLVRLSTVDIVIVVFYFALVLSIGWYLKGRANTGEDFFMAGREMTAWVAGLSFLSANLGAFELMGWAGCAVRRLGVWINQVPSVGDVPLYEKALFWAAIVTLVFVILNIIFGSRDNRPTAQCGLRIGDLWLT